MKAATLSAVLAVGLATVAGGGCSRIAWQSAEQAAVRSVRDQVVRERPRAFRVGVERTW